MGIKKSIVISDENAEVIRRDYDGEWSFGVNQQLQDIKELRTTLHKLAQDLLPELSENDWHLILSALNGSVIPGETQRYNRHPYRLASDVCDDHGVEILDHCEPAFRESIQRIYELSQPEQFAVIVCAEWFWRNAATAPLMDTIEQFEIS